MCHLFIENYFRGVYSIIKQRPRVSGNNNKTIPGASTISLRALSSDVRSYFISRNCCCCINKCGTMHKKVLRLLSINYSLLRRHLLKNLECIAHCCIRIVFFLYIRRIPITLLFISVELLH